MSHFGEKLGLSPTFAEELTIVGRRQILPQDVAEGSFFSLDFETANEELSSPCSGG
jgi:hypothetical protein